MGNNSAIANWSAAALTLVVGVSPSRANTLEERQALLRQLTQQQQSVLEQRTRCINQARSLIELERCQRGEPVGHRGWHCPLW